MRPVSPAQSPLIMLYMRPLYHHGEWLCMAHGRLGKNIQMHQSGLQIFTNWINEVLFFSYFQCLKKYVINFPKISCVCNFLLYFGGVCFGFYSSTCHCHAGIWRLHFEVRILQSVPTVHFMLSLEYVSYSHASCPFFYVYMWLYYFVCFQDCLRTHTLYFYYTQFLFHCVPLMLLMETLMEEEIIYWVLQSLGQCLHRHLQVLAVQLETKVKKASLFFILSCTDFVLLPIIAVSTIQSLQIHLGFGVTVNDNVLFNKGTMFITP